MYPGLTYITLDSSIFIIDAFFTDVPWENYITASISYIRCII